MNRRTEDCAAGGHASSRRLFLQGAALAGGAGVFGGFGRLFAADNAAVAARGPAPGDIAVDERRA